MCALTPSSPLPKKGSLTLPLTPWTFNAFVPLGAASTQNTFSAVVGEAKRASWYEIDSGKLTRTHAVLFPGSEGTTSLLSRSPFFDISSDQLAIVATVSPYRLLSVNFNLGTVSSRRDLTVDSRAVAVSAGQDTYYAAFADGSIASYLPTNLQKPTRSRTNLGNVIAMDGAALGGTTDALAVLVRNAQAPHTLWGFFNGNFNDANAPHSDVPGDPVAMRVMQVGIVSGQMEVAWVLTRNPNRLLVYTINRSAPPIASFELPSEPLRFVYGVQGALGLIDPDKQNESETDIAASTGMIHILLR